MMTISIPVVPETSKNPADHSADPDFVALNGWVHHGDRTALEQLFARHAAAALRLAARRLGNLSDAEDAVQDGFLTAMRTARRCDPGQGNVRGWLLAAVLNACSELRRNASRRTARERQSQEPSSPSSDPDLHEVVSLALAELPEQQRQPIELKYFAGLSYAEMSAALNRRESTLRNQVDRGLEALRTICARRGLATSSSALGVVLAALGQSLPGSDLAISAAVTRCAAVAGHGPATAAPLVIGTSGVVLAGGVLIVVATITIAFGFGQGWFGNHEVQMTTPADPPMVVEPPVPPQPPPIRENLGEYRLDKPGSGLGLVASTILLDDDKCDFPLVTIGALREEVVGKGSWSDTLFQPEKASFIPPDWSWSPEPGQRTSLDPVQLNPLRWLRAPRPGDDLYVVCVSPNRKQREGEHWPLDQDWRLNSLKAIAGGWHLNLDGVRKSGRPRNGTPMPTRYVQILSLGKAQAGTTTLTITVTWRRKDRLSMLFYPSASMVTEESLPIPVTVGAEAPPITLRSWSKTDVQQAEEMVQKAQVAFDRQDYRLADALAFDAYVIDRSNEKARKIFLSARSGESKTTAPQSTYWQIPHQGHLISKQTSDFPAEIGGLIGSTDSPWWPKDCTVAPSSAVLILGPTIQSLETMSLRSVQWEGSVATLALAIWQDRGRRSSNYDWRPLLPVSLRRPPSVVGPVTVVLRWERLVADQPGGCYVLQAGEPEFPGARRLEGLNVPAASEQR